MPQDIHDGRGRKRHGNLSLICSWEGCDHKAAKRDHMTSHMMVHCPLRTNVCGICEKTFKRSYDLRKHEITHTAAHHQAHARSRAVIYKELEIPFTTRLEHSTPVNRSRVYSYPQDQSSDWIGTDLKTLVSGPVHRASSFSGSRSSPYERAYPQKKHSYSSNRNDAFAASTSHWNDVGLGPIGEGAPLNACEMLVNPFQLSEQVQSNSSEFLESNELPSTQLNEPSGYKQPMCSQSVTMDPLTSVNWPQIFSYNMAQARAESPPTALPSKEFPDLFGAGPPTELLGTNSLPFYDVHPASDSSLTSYEDLDLYQLLSAPTNEDPTAIPNIQMLNMLNLDGSHYPHEKKLHFVNNQAFGEIRIS